jgi:hypothetical protein
MMSDSLGTKLDQRLEAAQQREIFLEEPTIGDLP